MDRGIQQTEDRTEIHTHLLTTVSQSHNSKTTRESCRMGQFSMESHSSIQFLPTESSGIAPFFLMFGREAAVKHTLLESERPKYLGTDGGMINLELMTKLYMVIAHNLNEAGKARDQNKKKKNTKELEKLKIGDNVLVRDQAFQPKYKDFCIVRLLGKNQIEIEDNHRHTTKVHCRDVKKIPMTEKVCQLYEEEQVGKLREGRKAVPSSKMPDLGWDIAETQLQECSKLEEVQELSETDTPVIAVPLQAMIAIVILIATILEHLKSCIQEIPGIARKATQAVKSAITKISHKNSIQNIRKTYKTAALVITLATNMTDHTSHMNQHQTANRNTQNTPGMRKLNDEYNNYN